MNPGPDVDLVLLTRDTAPVHESVQRGIDSQTGVELCVHRVVGRAAPADENRWQTIARARNEARTLGRSPWLMFLDDDVVLAEQAVKCLVDELQRRPSLAAIAVNYLQERIGYDPRQHVAMGATLFRRTVLNFLRFRWETGRCECQCCCDDLRRLGLGIVYSQSAQGMHLNMPAESHEAYHLGDTPSGDVAFPPRILAAFDRRHLSRFRHQFMATLRAHGNNEEVVAIGYGLYPSEQRVGDIGNVRLITFPVNGQLPPVRRLYDFQEVVRELPPETPVAYWDAGDVIFQARLANLWETVRQYPDRLLAVREPKGHPENEAVSRWCS